MENKMLILQSNNTRKLFIKIFPVNIHADRIFQDEKHYLLVHKIRIARW